MRFLRRQGSSITCSDLDRSTFSPSLLSYLNFLLLTQLRRKGTYIYPAVMLTLWLLNAIIVRYLLEDSDIITSGILVGGSWNSYFYSFAISINAFLALIYGTGCAIAFFGANDGLDLIVCSKPFKRESVVAAKLVALVTISLYIGVANLLSSLTAFMTGSSATLSKAVFFSETFLSASLSSLFFGLLTAIFSYYLSPRNSRIAVLSAKIFFSSILGASITLILLFSTSSTLKPLVTESNKYFGREKRFNFSLLKIEDRDNEYMDRYYYFGNSPLVNPEAVKGKAKNATTPPPKIGLSVEELDILERIATAAKRSSILPKVLHVINIPYQLSLIGSFPLDKNNAASGLNTTSFLPPTYPLLTSPESSFYLTRYEADKVGEDYSALPIKRTYKGTNYFVIPSSLFGTSSYEVRASKTPKGEKEGGSDQLEVDSVNVEDAPNNNSIFKRYSVMLANQSYVKDLHTPIRLITKSKVKGKVVSKGKVVGAFKPTDLLILINSSAFKNLLKGFADDKESLSKIKSGNDLKLRLLNYLRLNLGKEVDPNGYVGLLAAVYVSIYMDVRYPREIRSLAIDAANLPVNVEGKQYTIGYPAAPGRTSKFDTLFTYVSNYLHYDVNYKWISFGTYLAI